MAEKAQEQGKQTKLEYGVVQIEFLIDDLVRQLVKDPIQAVREET